MDKAGRNRPCNHERIGFMKASSLLTAVFLAVVLTAALGAAAEVTVSVTLTGPIEEMLPILEQLRQAGYGAGDEDALRLEMHSSAGAEQPEPPAEEPAAAAPEPVPQEPPQPGLAAFMAEPDVARAGDKVWLSILVLNGVGVVDTVSATVNETGRQIELYDNGEHGDPIAGDGQWSAEVVMNPDLPAGRYPLTILAFNANGQPVTVDNEDGGSRELSQTVTLEVVR